MPQSFEEKHLKICRLSELEILTGGEGCWYGPGALGVGLNPGLAVPGMLVTAALGRA